VTNAQCADLPHAVATPDPNDLYILMLGSFRRRSRGEDTMTRNLGIIRSLFALFCVTGIAALLSAPAYAHCDGMDGPVVKAAQSALAKNDVNLVLIWVREADEAEIRRAFDRAVEVRKLSPQAKDLADTYFFETLVRVHRAGEGATFTGLKPASRDLGPAIPAADRALNSGDVAPLTNLLVERMRAGLLDRYEQAMAAKNFRTQDIDAGRAYVERYVAFIHYVEGVFESATRPVHGHYAEGGGGGHDEK